MELHDFAVSVGMKSCNTYSWTGPNGKIEALDRAADSLELLKQLGALLTWQGKVIQ